MLTAIHVFYRRKFN